MSTDAEFMLQVALSFLWIAAVAVFCILTKGFVNSLLSTLVGKPIVLPMLLDWIIPFFVAILITLATAEGVHFIQRKRNRETK
jgi:hypothetical protein